MSRLRAPVLVALLVLSSAIAGCVSFYPVETTPEGILSSVTPGDVVRMTTRDRGALSMRVWSVGDEHIRGRIGEDPTLVDVRLDRIESLEVERPDLKKAMLRVLLPTIIGVAILCERQDCESRSVVTATF